MSWAEGIFDFALNTKEGEMMDEIKDCLDRERGVQKPVHLKLILLDAEPVDGYDNAMKKIDDLYKEYGRRNNYGIRYMDYGKVKPTKKMEDMKRQIGELEQKSAAYATEHSVLAFKAEFVGCPCCGSKLKRERLKTDKCPLCGTDMRSKTTIETLNGYRSKIRELEKRIRTEENKQKGRAEMRWMVHAESYIG